MRDGGPLPFVRALVRRRGDAVGCAAVGLPMAGARAGDRGARRGAVGRLAALGRGRRGGAAGTSSAGGRPAGGGTGGLRAAPCAGVPGPVAVRGPARTQGPPLHQPRRGALQRARHQRPPRP
ncbi:hypothetical protein BS78_03G164800 [Paspalum vaginatum]|nr:hypothetical protein BS78_03G164800 [Paspalum vaginatum]